MFQRCRPSQSLQLMTTFVAETSCACSIICYISCSQVPASLRLSLTLLYVRMYVAKTLHYILNKHLAWWVGITSSPQPTESYFTKHFSSWQLPCAEVLGEIKSLAVMSVTAIVLMYIHNHTREHTDVYARTHTRTPWTKTHKQTMKLLKRGPLLWIMVCTLHNQVESASKTISHTHTHTE